MKKSQIYKIIKIYLGAMLVGGIIGFGLVYLPDGFKEFIHGFWSDKIYNGTTGIILIDFLLFFLMFIAACYLQFIIHEGGHLVMGRLTGYKFVSFRIGSLTIVNDGGKLKMKRFAVAGTGGQCLMAPPDVSPEVVPYKAYNLGGVLFNFISVVLSLLTLILFTVPFPLGFLLLSLIILGIALILLNGIPMKLSGIANDAYNLILLRDDKIAHISFALQLKVNFLLSKGVRLRDMPEDCFVLPEGANLDNYFHVAVKLLEGSRYLDQLNFDKYQACLEEIEPHLPNLIQLYRNEVLCEIVFCKIIKGVSRDEIESLFTPDLRKYATLYSKYMISKKRLLYAYALLIEEDKAKASQIYKETLTMGDSSPLKGEVEGEVEIMEYVSKHSIIDFF